MEIKSESGVGYVCVKASGQFKADEAARLVSAWVAEVGRLASSCAVWDIKQVSGLDSPQISVLECFEGSKFIAEALPIGFRLAILVTPQQLPTSRFSEDVMVNRGANVKVTTSPKEALDWLRIKPTVLPVDQFHPRPAQTACEHW